jgi:hypothetical protein
MSNGCWPPTAQGSGACVGPASRTVGTAVETQTVKALLTEQALRRLTASNQHHFCADPACNIVYFDAAGATYRRTDVRVPIWRQLQEFRQTLGTYLTQCELVLGRSAEEECPVVQRFSESQS